MGGADTGYNTNCRTSGYEFNGGGIAKPASNGICGATGGGATDVRLVGGTWDTTTSLISRIMVAAGGVWSSNYLSFDGVDDHVMVAEINPDVLTIEAVYAATDQSGSAIMIGNIHSGGYAVAMSSSGYVKGMYYIGDGYKEVFSSEQVKLNEKKLVSTSYDSNTIRLFINGFLESSLSQTGAIVKPGSSTYLAIGANPIGSTVNMEYYNGKIYSVRVYNRALTEEEVLHNYLYDEQNFKLD